MAKRLDSRLARWLVRLLPVDVRDAHGAEMEQVIGAANRERPPGVISAVAFWFTALLDIVRVAPAQHAAALVQDVGYTWRGLRRAPGFAIAALLTIALGTGAILAVFVVVNAVLLRPLPFAEPAGVGLIWAKTPDGSRTWLSFPELADLSTRSTTLEAVAGLIDLRMAMTGQGVPEEVDVVGVSASLFSLLGVQAQMGRLLHADDDGDSSARVVVLSHGLWVRRFGAAPDVVGTSIVLDGRSYAVAGVLPRSFGIVPPSSVFPRRADAWVALQPHLVSRARDVRHVHALARVRAGIPFDTARGEVASIGAAVSREFGSAYRGCCWTLEMVSMQQDVVSGVRPVLLVLFGTVAVVLLLACVNVAVLLLARADARRREMAVRAALGASRGRLVRQLLTEALCLALIGGSVGLLLAFAAPQIARIPEIGSLPRFSGVSVDLTVLGFAVIVAAVTAGLLAIAPAFELSGRRVSVAEGLRSSSRSLNRTRVSRVLAAAEVGLASTVLVVALVSARSLATLLDVDPGFDTSGVSTARVSLPPRYADAASMGRFFDELVRRLAAMPGVESAGAVTQLPLSGAMLGSTFSAGDRNGEDVRLDVDLRGTTPGYFRAMDIAIRQGRGFSESDTSHSPAVAVIDEIAARRLWPGQHPIGRRVRWMRQPDMLVEVVGVVGSVRHRGVEQPARATVYRPHTQYARHTMYVVARAADGHVVPGSVVAATVNSIDPDQPVAEVSTMAALRSRSFARPGFGAALGGLLALLALVLTAVGVYGLHAFAVVQRRREIGVRLAMGGAPGRVERLILTDGVATALAGLCVGLPGALAAARWMRGFVPGMVATDAVTVPVAAGVMLAVALVACWIPARRASRVDPAIVLRADP